jgi:hypothetical protein
MKPFFMPFPQNRIEERLKKKPSSFNRLSASVLGGVREDIVAGRAKTRPQGLGRQGIYQCRD